MKTWLRRHPLWATASVSALLFLLAAGALYFAKPAPQERTITVTAQRFSYSPNTIEINRGDHVIIRLLSNDVHHGFYLDGYEQETSARPGMDGTVSFVATKTGRFSFRCSMTCGPFHPYMIGYLRVKPDLRLLGSLWLFGSVLAVALVSLRTRGLAHTVPPQNENGATSEEKA